MNLISYIEHHPLVAFVIGSIHLVGTIVLENMQVPLIIMQLLQIGAWSITMTVGLISIYGAFKKWRKK